MRSTWHKIKPSVFLIILFTVLAPSPAHAQRLEFSAQPGTSGLDESRGVAVDSAGNIYLTGVTDGAVDGNNHGGHDAWLAKYDSSGGLRWIKQLGSRGDDFANGVAVDSGGNVYVTGSTSDQLGSSFKGALDAWLAKYDSSGTLLWVTQFGTATDDTSSAVAVDAANNVYLTGTTFDQLGATHFGDGDVFLAKYDGQGALLWIDQFGTRQLDSARALTCHPLGGVYVTGDTADALGGSFAGGTDAFLVSYDSSGTRQWVKQFGHTGIDESYAVATDGANNIYITGRTDGNLAGTNQGRFDAWVAAYGTTGTRLWTRQLGTSADDVARGATVDASGNLYLTGWTAGSLGGATQGGNDVWVAQYQSNGNQRGTQQFGTSQADEALAIAVDSARNYYLTGTTAEALAGRYQGGTDAWFRAYSQTPAITSVSPGSGATGNTITILGKNFNGTTSVKFNGASAVFTINSQSQITATVPAAATTGRITVTNSYGTATSATDFIVTTIPAVTLTATPSSRTIGASQSTTFTINLNRTNYPGLVDLSLSGLPTGATYSFTADPTTASSSTLRINTTAATVTGTRTLTISASATGITIAPITVTLTITGPPAVTLTASPTNNTVTTGQSITYTINLNRISYPNNVTLSLSGLPAGATYNFNPHPVQGQIANLNINTLTSTTTGIFTLTISASATGITINPITVTLIVVHCCTALEIFVGNHRPGPSGNISLVRFAGDAVGDVSPSSEFYVDGVTALARDGSGNIYVASDVTDSIRVYAPGSRGMDPPIRNISGPSTKLGQPTGLALDSQGNLYVAVRGSDYFQSAMLKFAAGADGDVAPVAIIPSIIPSRIPAPGEVAGVNTGIELASGVAVDAAGSIYVVSLPEMYGPPWKGKLLIFAPGANGDVAPVVEITMGLEQPQQVTLDENENIYVTNRGGLNASITVYAAGPTADVAPVRTITSVELQAPFGIAVDGAGRIFVASWGRNNILVFDTGASGNVVPFRKIEGASTGLNAPLGIAVRY